MVELLAIILLGICIYYLTKEMYKAAIMGMAFIIVLYSCYFVAVNVIYVDFNKQDHIEVPKSFYELDEKIDETFPRQEFEYRSVK